MPENPQTPDRRSKTCDMPHDVGCQWADEAAERAVKKTFAILGVDVDKPEHVEEFREDLRFGKSLRKNASRGMTAFITTVCIAAAYALWYGIKSKLGIE